MRPLPLALLLAVALTAPAVAHGDEHGLTLADLVLLFDPLSQSQVFSFNLTNGPDTSASGIWATITLHEDQFPVSTSVGSLVPDETKRFDVKVPLRASVKGCIFAFTTAVGQNKVSDRVCGQTSGLTLAPTPLPAQIPDIPDQHDVHDTLP